jgi:hypothetical protein
VKKPRTVGIEVIATVGRVQGTTAIRVVRAARLTSAIAKRIAKKESVAWVIYITSPHRLPPHP